MLRLLVPVDNSPSAGRALGHALWLAAVCGPMELAIVFAHQPPLAEATLPRVLSDARAREEQRRQSEAALGPAIARALDAGVTFSSHVLIGEVPQVIVECAEQMACDGVVMGARGNGGVGGLFMGSVAARVLQLAPMPVTFVK